VGEEGINLSGGQKQLVALARALYRKPQFLLLDEPTASMDKNTERFVLSLLEEVKTNAGILLITHHEAMAVQADTMYQLASKTLRRQEKLLV
ncbi:MAG: ATP-binding cassette domain-containing protein, partial [Verrucomicrobia bacterium]|nr:ATP-binding cassette domain-containing protein [Cytophagales bacterium]